MTPIYAVPDIHGHLAELDRALALIEADGGAAAETIFLGDLVDRGPDSRGVIERLRGGQEEGRRWTVLAGNHDRLFTRFLRTGIEEHARILSGLGWLHVRLGGAETLASYDLDVPAYDAPADLLRAARDAVPPAHFDWLDARPLWAERGKLLFVHAGLRPGVPLAAQDPEDIVWIREPFLSATAPHPWLVVHGHTALEEPAHFGNRIDLDGGAAYGRPLIPAVFEGTECFLLTDAGRQPLKP